MSVAVSRSPSPAPASPGAAAPPRSFRSRSPSAGYLAGGGGGSSNSSGFYSSRGTFGPPPGGYGYYNRSPGRHRPASASPGGVYQPAFPGRGEYGSGEYGAGGGAGGEYYRSPSLPQIPHQGQGGQGQQQRMLYQGVGGPATAAAAAAQRPLSAPPRSQGGALATHGSDEASEVLEMLNSADRCVCVCVTSPGALKGAKSRSPATE